MATLILVRHGESEWNSEGLFTGWVDVDLSETGVTEAENAGRLLARYGPRTSRSTRLTSTGLR
jgi:2,3-bisphosphoglycerate-dependent phosphoglycerate mutase